MRKRGLRGHRVASENWQQSKNGAYLNSVVPVPIPVTPFLLSFKGGLTHAPRTQLIQMSVLFS